MTIITSRWPPMPLNKKQTQSEEIGFADLPQRMSGNASTMAAHVVGGDVIANAENPCPKNPSGDYGHDHSGGYMGRPVFKSIATISFDDGSFFNTSKYGYDGGSAPNRIGSAELHNSNLYINPVRLESEPGQPGDTNGTTDSREFILWVPPCDLSRGAYLNCGFNVTIAYTPVSFLTTVPITAADEIRIRLINTHSALRQDGIGVSGFPIAGETGILANPINEEIRFEESDGGNLTVVPGSLNPMKFGLQVALDGGGTGPRACEINILDLEIGVNDASSS